MYPGDGFDVLLDLAALWGSSGGGAVGIVVLSPFSPIVALYNWGGGRFSSSSGSGEPTDLDQRCPAPERPVARFVEYERFG